MSDDPFQIIAKLEDYKSYSLAPFIEYFIDKGFEIEAYHIEEEKLPPSLQNKIIINKNYFPNEFEYPIPKGGFYLNNTYYELNNFNYKCVYLPNKDKENLFTYIMYGESTAYSKIKIRLYNHRDVSQEFFIALVDSVIYGRLLICNILYRGVWDLRDKLGLNDSANLTTILYPLIFKNFNPYKIFNYSYMDEDDFYTFFIENNLKAFKDCYTRKIEEDEDIFLSYYNKTWSYEDYIYVGISDGEFDLPDLEVLLYEKYANHFNCPKPILDKAWQWYQESGYTFMED